MCHGTACDKLAYFQASTTVSVMHIFSDQLQYACRRHQKPFEGRLHVLHSRADPLHFRRICEPFHLVKKKVGLSHCKARLFVDKGRGVGAEGGTALLFEM